MKLYKLILNKIKLLLLVVITLIPLKCFALVDATDKFYVNDYGKVLSQKDETFIYENSKKLYEKTKAQIVVVTVKDLEGQDINSYADSLFEKFKIGTKEESYGLLILLSVNDRKIRVTTGSGTEEFLPDGKVGRIIDNSFIPYGKENKLDKGIMNLYKSLYNEMGNSLGYNGKLSVTVNKDRETSLENNSYNIFSSDKYIVKIIITLLVLSVKFKSKSLKVVAFSLLELYSMFIIYSVYTSCGIIEIIIFLLMDGIFNYFCAFHYASLKSIIKSIISIIKCMIIDAIIDMIFGSSSSSSSSSDCGHGGSTNGGGASRSF